MLIVEQRFEKLQWEDRLGIIEAVNSVLRNAIEVFSSKEAAGQWAPRNESVVILREEGLIVYFHISSNEHVILILSTDRLMKVQSFTNSQGLQNYLCIPVACRPVEGLSFFDHLMERSANLLQRSRVVMHVRVKDVHVIHLQPQQRFFNTLTDVFSVGSLS